ncbi:uncharacterized protein BDR25DRAFT_307232 [Lindgomyces ingoldianus]|uniref:Uncharacterized protein n=1 Tax=Lindgomyces ingoldianus TaxID=673940 RepID=A0ACB6QCS5_9PLEO|nr:uncharacterized protein BDR25DRAFT_307232 [Lindgomyces ingoldianus]KAF2464408.1 hypothetical protein BDR25DRAFT_307232 [Lindgomyces ingoldianus]
MVFAPLFLLSLLATASPLDRRSCAIEVPSYIGWADSDMVDYNFFPKAGNTDILASKYTGPQWTQWRDTLLEFNIPQGSWGCQLEMYFEKGFGLVFRDHPYGPVKTDVWNVDGNVPRNPFNYTLTWNTAPSTTSLFGTTGDIELPPQPTPGYSQDVKKVINSAPCKEKMTYRLRVPAEVTNGGVRMYQTNGHPFGGWRIVHNC